MNREQQFQEELDKILAKIAELPLRKQEELRPLIEETVRRFRENQKNFATINDYFSDLSLKLTYLQFDLEAQERE